MNNHSRIIGCVSALATAFAAAGAQRTETFDVDPGWHAHNCRAAQRTGREVKQDFGFSGTTAHCGARGEIGGFIQPVAEPAYYAKAIPPRTLEEPLAASGKLVCKVGQGNTLIGFFNASTLGEWRTANTLALRIYGRGEFFYAYVEYATQKWRAGAGEFRVTETATGKSVLRPFKSGDIVHTWSLEYDPLANGGNGAIKARLDDEEIVATLTPAHKADGAVFNRFGLLNVMKHFDGGGELWLDEVTVNGERHRFEEDPHWGGSINRRTFTTRDIRPWFDFGFSPTHFARGKATGELGGLVFRGDGRSPDLLAFYGGRLEPLDLTRPLKASGKVALLRAVSDSDTLIGFFHSEHSLDSGGTDRYGLPPDFLGISIGGPSREGFFFSPAYRIHGTEERTASAGPYIYPNGQPHEWSLEYDPDAANGRGRVIVRLDGAAAALEMESSHKTSGAHFNRFGLITTHRDGNGQRIYFDDLSYTASQRE
ncbi:MAG: hypothetical protein HYY24_18205 [Verrucomicrobia bacterium]|nr:hypothetical protein [Verrucomicrobiota bacterium]